MAGSPPVGIRLFSGTFFLIICGVAERRFFIGRAKKIPRSFAARRFIAFFKTYAILKAKTKALFKGVLCLSEG